MRECGVSGGIALHRAGLGNTDILGAKSLSLVDCMIRERSTGDLTAASDIGTSHR